MVEPFSVDSQLALIVILSKSSGIMLSEWWYRGIGVGMADRRSSYKF